MGPPNYKQFMPVFPVQSHLSHFNLGSQIHLLVVLIFLTGLTLMDVGIHMMHFYSQLLQAGSHVLPHWNGPDAFASAMPVALLPLL